jgi:cyanophycinase
VRDRSLSLALVGLVLLVMLPALRPAPAAGGHLLIVGGGEQPPELVSHFVELAGGSGKAKIAVVPMASSEPAETGKEKADELVGLGATVMVLNLNHDQAMSDSVAHLLDGVTGVWFTGGDQARVTPVLLGTPALRAMQAVRDRGGVIGGTSAGAAIMSDSMITGNQYRAGVDTVGYYDDEFPTIGRRTIEVVPGLGFLHGAIVDQHFIRRERHNRLLSVVLERPTLVGVGIDESTALEVEPDGRWEVRGAGSVMVYDARHARITPAGAPLLGASGIQVAVLPTGSQFDPQSGTAVLAPR